MIGPETRYAGGLLSMLKSCEEEDKIGEALKAFSDLLSDNAELRRFIKNPSYSTELKKETIFMILPKDIPCQAISFISLLADKGRLSLLPNIYSEYVKLMNRKRNVITIKVFSALPLEESQLERIRIKYVKKFDAASAKIECLTDSSLMGGIKIRVGDYYVDDTLLGRLKGIQRNLKLASR